MQRKDRGLLYWFWLCVPCLFPLLSPALMAQQFLMAPQYPTGGFTYAVATADFNSDGKSDLVLVDLINNRVEVLLGNGDGTFRPFTSYPTGWNPYSVVVADFNGDGVLDLAVASFGVTASLNGPSLVSVLLGNGDGTFQPNIDTGIVGILPETLVPGDFNGDGKLDLAVVYFPETYITPFLGVMLGNGDGTFQPPITVPVSDTTGSNSGCLVVADFKGDGKLDLAGTNSAATSVDVLLGNGDGTLQAHQSYAVGASGCVQAGDFNGDGKIDLAVVGGNTISILLGNGNGTFQTHVDTSIPVSLSSGGQGTVTGAGVGAVGDFNGDGKLDLAWTDSNGDAISVIFGNGDGTFQAPLSFSTGTVFTSGLAVADFNGDGKPDLVAANGQGSSAGILLNRGNGLFDSNRLYDTGNYPSGEVIADFNGDGKQDLAVANSGSNTVSVLLGNGDGTVQPRIDYATGANPIALLAVDLNGDGKIDLIAANAGGNTVSVLLGKGDGSFGPHADFGTGSYPQWIAAADFNADGKLDIAVANNGSNTVSILFGRGDGTFQPHVDYPTSFNTFSVTAADFNGDGKPDLAVGFPGDPFNQSTTPGGIDILVNQGNGAFAPAVVYPSAGITLGVLAADLNHDGKPDLVATNGGQTCRVLPDGTVVCSTDKSIGVLLGNGNGTFQAPTSYPAAVGPNAIAFGDLNNDGELDAITANASDTVSVFWGNGDGTFRPRVDYVAGKSPSGVAVGDFSGDLKDDLAVSFAGGNNVSILLNTLNNPSFVLSASGGSQYVSSVASDPVGILCNGSGTCSASYNAGTAVTLLAIASPAFDVFTGWTGDCTGLGACIVDMTADRSVVANFAPNPTSFVLTVKKAGNGTGTVQASPDVGGIDCGSTCSGSFGSGSTFVLGAAPDPGSAFTGWSAPGCERALDCTVAVTSNLTVTATFTLNVPVAISVTKAGSGGGTVTSSPAGINCGTTCSASFGTGTALQLTATAKANSVFAGWSGGCSGTGACNITMSTVESVTAAFNSSSLPDFSLSPASTGLNLPRGGQATDVITLAPLNGSFASAIQLTCMVAGPAPVPSCGLTPTSVTPGVTSVNSTLTVTAASTAAQSRLSGSQLRRLAYVVWFPLMFGLVMMGRSNRNRRAPGILCGLLLLLFLHTACVSGSGGKQGSTNYTVTVTGTSGAVQHTTQVTVTAQ